MNSIKVLFIFLITIGSLNSVIAQNEKSSSLTFKAEEIDFGKIAQNADGERVFEFTNNGDAPLVISNVKTSCGCTVPTYPKQAILPGESGEIVIEYDTKRVGAFSKTITVLSNAKEATKILKIKGEVLKSSS